MLSFCLCVLSVRSVRVYVLRAAKQHGCMREVGFHAAMPVARDRNGIKSSAGAALISGLFFPCRSVKRYRGTGNAKCWLCTRWRSVRRKVPHPDTCAFFFVLASRRSASGHLRSSMP